MREAKLGHYTFLVSPLSTKDEIKKEIEKIFDVHVKKIHTMNYRSKKKRNFRGLTQTIKRKKKAIVILSGDEKIELFEEKKGKK